MYNVFEYDFAWDELKYNDAVVVRVHGTEDAAALPANCFVDIVRKDHLRTLQAMPGGIGQDCQRALCPLRAALVLLCGVPAHSLAAAPAWLRGRGEAKGGGWTSCRTPTASRAPSPAYLYLYLFRGGISVAVSDVRVNGHKKKRSGECQNCPMAKWRNGQNDRVVK